MTSHKNIVLCSDGTGNTMMKGRGTNVWKLYEAVDLTAHRWPKIVDGSTVYGTEQIAFYDDGVGSQQNKVLKILGGAFGFGLKRNVRDLYKVLCRAYQPGDAIYIFGFSRGAYTARVLAGLILTCGILDARKCKSRRDLDEKSLQAYEAFRSHFSYGTTKGKRANRKAEKAASVKERMKDRGADGKSLEKKYETVKRVAEKAAQDAQDARNKAERVTDKFRLENSVLDDIHAPEGKVKIKFVGVWDTVAAIGLPFKELTDFWNRFIYPFMFPDFQLDSRVEKGCHALSIDDERLTFHPMLWDETVTSGAGQIEQVWFAGVHSNVGGGYPKQGMSLVALDWMMQKATEQGLLFIDNEKHGYRHLQNVHDKLFDSRNGLAIYYRYCPRDIEKICQKFHARPKIHISALERIALGTQDYAPGNLPGKFEIVTTDPNSGAALEDPSILQQVSAKIGPDAASRNVGHWIKFRRHMYHGFLSLTLLVLFGATFIRSDVAGKDKWVSEGWDTAILWVTEKLPFGAYIYEYLLLPFLIYWQVTAFVLLMLIGLYVARGLIRSKLRNTFSEYWRNKLSKPWW